MPTARVNGVELYYEVTGDGFPLVLSHEFGGSHQSWKAQVSFFSHRYRVITYNHRGFPPSEVPEDPTAYSQEALVEDLHQLLRHLGIRQAHIGGLSMGGNVALNFGLAHPEMARALVVASTGSGSTDRERFEAELEQMARRFETEGAEAVARGYTKGPSRVQLLRKDPRGWEEFYQVFINRSAAGSARILRGVIRRRATIFALQPRLQQLQVPALIMVGDEDDPCLEPAIFMKRNIPGAGLVVFPQSGHAINLEEPDLFHRAVLDFLTLVEAGKWAVRPREHVMATPFSAALKKE